MEKHQPWKREWINLPIALKLQFLEDVSLELREDTILAITSLSVSRENYFHSQDVWKIIMWKFNAFFRSFTSRCKVIIKDVSNIIRIGHGITITKESAAGTLEATVFR